MRPVRLVQKHWRSLVDVKLSALLIEETRYFGWTNFCALMCIVALPFFSNIGLQGTHQFDNPRALRTIFRTRVPPRRNSLTILGQERGEKETCPPDNNSFYFLPLGIQPRWGVCLLRLISKRGVFEPSAIYLFVVS